MSTAGLRRALILAALVVGSLATAAPSFGVDSFTPNPVNVTLSAGDSTTIDKTLHLDALPGAADILIAIDTTGSMGTAIAQAKAQATALCNDVQAQIPGARFAVWDFKDIPDRPATNGILKSVNAFTSSCAAVQAAVNLMSAGGGGDFAEAYNPVFHDAYSDPLLNASRNADAVQFLVVLGDAPPHNSPASATAPACGNQPPADPAGMTSTTEIAGLNANDITLLMIHYSTPGNIPIACYQQLSGATGGTAVESGGDLSGEIIGQIQASAAHIDQVRLVVSGVGCQTPAGLNITFNPPNPPPYGPFTAPVDIPFQETITAPTVAGNYSCTVTAVVDGVARATQTVNARVTAGEPRTLTLTPADDTNTAGDTHCVTATVRDEFGNPVSGVTVNFTVTGANSNGGAGVTDANGQATFCYVGTHAGNDTITATAVGGSNPSATAHKTWRPGEARTLDLTPAAATNVVGSQHCVTATVRDGFGNPVPGVPVSFTVSGSSSASGTVTTGPDGTAQFCYTGPALPGADLITATAQSGSHPSDTATKAWVVPTSTAGCKVTGGGRITAANGDKATFGGNANGTGPSGEEEYQDHGPATDINVHSLTITAVTCSADRTSASIFGTATINGGGSYNFRIDVRDLAEPGRTDRYRIRLSNGYDSGDQQLLLGGNIQIH
jgi:Mg-chelatase subunit ChlD